MNIVENNQKKAWKKPTLKKLSISETKAGDGEEFDGSGFDS